MAQYKNYVIAQTLDEAYALNAKKSTVIVAGNMWLRMCGMRRQTALDLSALGLDFIKEDEQGFTIGAMTTLRTMETHPALNAAFGGVFARALEPIVGTQFRNGATVGGSVFSRFGFSDVSTLLLAMDAKVVTYARGEVPLDEFQKEKWDRDILTAIRIEKGRSAAIESVRLSKTDIPVLVCAASADERGVRVALGSRPARAMIVAEGAKPEELDYMRMAADIPMGTNARASEAYRRKVAPVLMERAVQACLKR